MAIFQIAEYEVKSDAVDKVKHAIQEFIHYVETSEPGTLLYSAWQKQNHPTQFTHFFAFENDAAKAAHGRSQAVREFEAVYRAELVGSVVFTDCAQIATNQWLQTATR
jgi:quinol monooxygenase YgiN